jgi:hypothetical protein
MASTFWKHLDGRLSRTKHVSATPMQALRRRVFKIFRSLCQRFRLPASSFKPSNSFKINGRSRLWTRLKSTTRFVNSFSIRLHRVRSRLLLSSKSLDYAIFSPDKWMPSFAASRNGMSKWEQRVDAFLSVNGPLILRSVSS